MTRSYPVSARGILYASILLATVPGPALAEPMTGLVYQTVTLDNGLQVITLEDFTAPVVNVQLWYHVGSKDEDPQRQGFAHMFEHMMFRGTDRLGPTDHFDLLRKTGGYTNAYTAFDQTVYHETVPANQLDLALWLEAERMAFLKIDQAAFDTERQVVEEERRMRVSQPYGMLPEKALAEIFKVHPYRWTPLGNITHLRAASVPELRAFWTRYYVPNNAVLVIVGAVRHEQAQAAARRYFGWIPRYPDPPRITVREPESKGRTLVFKEDNAPAPVVGIGGRTVPAGHPDEMALRLLTTILGGGESSRAYRRLVAGQELAVMTVGLSESIEHEGFIGFVAVLPPVGGKPEKALAELEAIIEQARNEPVDKRELDKARNNMLRNIVVENLTAEGRASTLGRMAVLAGDVSKVNARLEELRRLSPDDLQRVARKYLASDRLFKATVERNLAGALSGWLGFKKKEELPPVTAKPETDPPPPGRPGLKRPEGFPATAPVVGQLTYDPTPRHESFALPNGLKVLVVENHKGPFITVTLGLRAGAWCENKPGSAALAMGMLTKGSSRHSEAQLAEELERYAITLSGNGGMDGSNVYASCLTEHVDRAVRLMGEVVLTPMFPEDEFRKLRDRVRAGLVISTNEPAYAADREFRRRVFGRHPYARAASGEVADVDALTLEDVRGW
ncbi:MAG: insulinase family protein, partial [Phycisphaerae bacterium]